MLGQTEVNYHKYNTRRAVNLDFMFCQLYGKQLKDIFCDYVRLPNTRRQILVKDFNDEPFFCTRKY